MNVSARYVLMNDVVNGAGSYYGLSEVKFTAAPEPNTAALIIVAGASGLLCYGWRKRK